MIPILIPEPAGSRRSLQPPPPVRAEGSRIFWIKCFSCRLRFLDSIVAQAFTLPGAHRFARAKRRSGSNRLALAAPFHCGSVGGGTLPRNRDPGSLPRRVWLRSGPCQVVLMILQSIRLTVAHRGGCGTPRVRRDAGDPALRRTAVSNRSPCGFGRPTRIGPGSSWFAGSSSMPRLPPHAPHEPDTPSLRAPAPLPSRPSLSRRPPPPRRPPLP